jgi:hypothetical protein
MTLLAKDNGFKEQKKVQFYHETSIQTSRRPPWWPLPTFSKHPCAWSFIFFLCRNVNSWIQYAILKMTHKKVLVLTLLNTTSFLFSHIAQIELQHQIKFGSWNLAENHEAQNKTSCAFIQLGWTSVRRMSTAWLVVSCIRPTWVSSHNGKRSHVSRRALMPLHATPFPRPFPLLCPSQHRFPS